MTTASSGCTGPTTAAAAEPDVARTHPDGRRVRAGRAPARGTAGADAVPVPARRRRAAPARVTYIPVVNMFGYSFTDWDGLEPDRRTSSASTTTSRSSPARSCSRVFYVSLYYIGASVVQIALALYFATVLTLQDAVPEPVQGHPVLPVPHQRRRDRHHLPVLLPARRHARLGRCARSASTSPPAVARRPRHRQLLARRHVGLALHRA